jgi:hypothetical protein
MVEALLLVIYWAHFHWLLYKFTEIKITVLQECNQYVNAHLTVYLNPSIKWVKGNWYLYFKEPKIEKFLKYTFFSMMI